jgi:CRP-like cAMP-binding protein
VRCLELQKMPAKISGARSKTPYKQGHDGAGGRAVENAIVLALPRSESETLLAKCHYAELPVHGILNEIGKPIAHAYFVNHGLISIVTAMSDGKSVEVGVTGKEGFVGLPLVVGFATSPTRAIVQIAGAGLKISARDLKSVISTCPALEKSLQRYAQELSIQSIQIAACNRLHEVDERLARWLLMSQDRVGGSSFPLTQEFLSHMLGTRRASVTVAAGILQKAGLITYTRGRVKIENRRELENAACECYALINSQLERWEKDSR